jgi:putative endonuclease
MVTSTGKKSLKKVPGKKQRLGAFGEEITAHYLQQRGDEILERNWRIREGEVDLISLGSDGIFHFIEVKTRSSLAFGHPLEAINREKAHRLQRLALAWLATHGCLGCEYTIDVAAVLIALDGSHNLEFRAGIL